MISKVYCGAVFGVEGYIVEAEAFISNGLPGFDIVGLPDSAVKESKERVRAAIKNAGLLFPPKRITINLAPAHIRKEGPLFDLPIAIAVCHGLGYIKMEKIDSFICGELSLDGKIRPVSGVLPMIHKAYKTGIRSAIVPIENAPEASLIKGIDIYGATNMGEVIKHLNGTPLTPFSPKKITRLPPTELDFKDVKGQPMVKRALEIAAAGGHNLLMIGPPGSGKTMMASRLPSILPPLTFEEALEVTKIYSVSSLLSPENNLIETRPFRSPHHTASATSLTGGGRIPMPGEISLAHQGVLFLDELPEFQKNTLESLRQPMESKHVTVARVAGTATYPADFIFIAAMNPCPCGYLGDDRCRCTYQNIQRYQQKISGPLIDRVDMHIELMPVPYEDLQGLGKEEASKEIATRVLEARNLQMKRQGETNSHLNAPDILKYCITTKEARAILKDAFKALGLSARGYHKILKLSRTIADLDQRDIIDARHIGEAVQYRLLDRA